MFRHGFRLSPGKFRDTGIYGIITWLILGDPAFAWQHFHRGVATIYGERFRAE